MQAFITLRRYGGFTIVNGKMTTSRSALPIKNVPESIVEQLKKQLGNQYEVNGWQQLLPEASSRPHFTKGLVM